jgi:electron transport complex protein RnfB
MSKEGQDVYRALQQHLDAMPVGFPRTKSGSDQKVLKYFFTEDEARLALHVGYKPEDVETIQAKLGDTSLSRQSIQDRLDHMALAGGVLRHQHEGKTLYGVHPYVIGMYEIAMVRALRENRPYVSHVEDIGDFMLKFVLDMLYGHQRGFRTIPIEQSITPEHPIATYDELVALIEGNDGKFGVGRCVCKAEAGLKNVPCKVTKRQEVCMSFRDYAEIGIRGGFLREVTKQEMLDIARLSEKEGLVLQPENTQKPNWICACCGDCCGLLQILKMLPRPTDFAHGNFHATINESACTGCKTCERRCQMGAITVSPKTKKASIRSSSCIGCGLCVPTCKSKALHLEPNKKVHEPEVDLEAWMDLVQGHKKNGLQRAAVLAKILPHLIITGIKSQKAAKNAAPDA